MTLALLVLAACDKQLPHGIVDPLYELRGKHAAVPCEGCHGPGTPESLPTTCIDCHDADRPAPDHHPGLNCATCHTEDGWELGATPGVTPPTEPTPTGDTGTTAPDLHASLPPEQLCWDCHEAERSTPDHYADLVRPAKSWDCGPCHGVTDWAEAPPGLPTGTPFEHPARTPHGTFVGNTEQPAAAWVVACTTCHPVALTSFDCSTCHLDIFPHIWSDDTEVPGPTADATCLGCHIAGDL